MKARMSEQNVVCFSYRDGEKSNANERIKDALHQAGSHFKRHHCLHFFITFRRLETAVYVGNCDSCEMLWVWRCAAMAWEGHDAGIATLSECGTFWSVEFGNHDRVELSNLIEN